MADEDTPPVVATKMVDLRTGKPPELVDVEAFDRRFKRLLPGLAQDLVTLEKEGALYSTFWHEDSKTFRYYRVRLLPREIVQYVDGSVAQQEFDDAQLAGSPFEEAMEAISNPTVRELVRTYKAGVVQTDGTYLEIDIRGCHASFLPRELEALACGHRPDRYQLLPDLGDERSRLALVRLACSSFDVTARFLRDRGRGRPPILVEKEYDVQDILFATLRPMFPDLRYEDWTPKIAGRARRIDLVFPEMAVVLEVKIVRDASHAKSVVDELMVDIESYHSHPSCRRLLAFVYDPGEFLRDPEVIARELSGLRTKGPHTFEVEIIVRGG